MRCRISKLSTCNKATKTLLAMQYRMFKQSDMNKCKGRSNKTCEKITPVSNCSVISKFISHAYGLHTCAFILNYIFYHENSVSVSISHVRTNIRLLKFFKSKFINLMCLQIALIHFCRMWSVYVLNCAYTKSSHYVKFKELNSKLLDEVCLPYV